MTVLPATVESAIARLDGLEDAHARAAAREALSAIVEFHGEGLRLLLDGVRAASVEGEKVLQSLAENEVIASLLLLHGLHPLPLGVRVRRALGSVRAAGGGEGRGEVVSIDGAAVRLRVAGSERFRRAVVRAVEEAAPDVASIEVLGEDTSLVPLERLTRRRAAGHERCELCGQALDAEHEHLFDTERRQLKCACTACAMLFDSSAAKVRRVRRRATVLEAFRLSDAQWEALGVPVALAFFFYSSSLGEVIAAFPGPAGAMESVVSQGAWGDLVRANPVLAELEPDTSALLIDRLSETPTYRVVSIDECYRLTGLVRSRWQGVTGGDGAIRAVREFFAALAEGRS